MDNDIRNILSGSDLCVPIYMYRCTQPFPDFIYVYVCIYILYNVYVYVCILIYTHMYMNEDFLKEKNCKRKKCIGFFFYFIFEIIIFK